ncbi:glycosyltransferase family 4 protein [Candidatus Parcubacteria bacterium]|nr:glycosyltransferase family 4 protein [Candidatus Parcubacteria bacterium]
MNPSVCIYLEYYHLAKGRLYQNVGTGLLSSYQNQKAALAKAEIPVTEWHEGLPADCNIVQFNTPWLRSVWLMRKMKRQGKKVIVYAHTTAEDAQGVFWMNKYLPLKRYLRWAYGQANLVLCPSEYTKGLLQKYPVRTRLEVITNGVDTERFRDSEENRRNIRERFGLKDLVVFNVGLVIPRKGINTFINLARAFPENQFIWFGKVYSSTVAAQNLPKDLPQNIQFPGNIEGAERLYAAGDIFAFPSLEENQGMVILEAAAVGRPILVRDIPVYEGWLKHEENCLKAKDEADFAVQLKRLLEDASLRERLVANAKITAQHHGLEAVANRLKEMYASLLTDELKTQN